MQERLQKIIAASGIASRRAAEEMIVGGEVAVNGQVIRELGVKADPDLDHIKVRGKLIRPASGSAQLRYVLLNKPKGYLCSLADPKKRPLVTDLVPGAKRQRLHPVGRLDFNSEGLIILTNDGALTRVLTRAGQVEKVYKVKVKGAPTYEEIKRLGVDRRTNIRLAARTPEAGNCWYEVTLTEGRNRQIRRMFESIGHPVLKLRRIRIGHLTDRGLPPGHHRELTKGEVKRFQASANRP